MPGWGHGRLIEDCCKRYGPGRMAVSQVVALRGPGGWLCNRLPTSLSHQLKRLIPVARFTRRPAIDPFLDSWQPE